MQTLEGASKPSFDIDKVLQGVAIFVEGIQASRYDETLLSYPLLPTLLSLHPCLDTIVLHSHVLEGWNLLRANGDLPSTFSGPLFDVPTVQTVTGRFIVMYLLLRGISFTHDANSFLDIVEAAVKEALFWHASTILKLSMHCHVQSACECARHSGGPEAQALEIISDLFGLSSLRDALDTMTDKYFSELILSRSVFSSLFSYELPTITLADTKHEHSTPPTSYGDSDTQVDHIT